MDGALAFPGTDGLEGPWRLYNRLIEGVPAGVLVHDCCLGTRWSYVEADCGMGIAWTPRERGVLSKSGDLRGRELREVARLAKSWSFEEAALGVAALNAWYSRPDKLANLGAQPGGGAGRDMGDNRRGPDAFALHADQMAGKDVVVVGHFPHLEHIAEWGGRLTVLERRVQDQLDTPDSACEYVIPGAQLVFLTGVTLINKTAPRLLQLAEGARTVMVGPSAVMAPALLEEGADMVAGSAVVDPEAVRHAVKSGTGMFACGGLEMYTLE